MKHLLLSLSVAFALTNSAFAAPKIQPYINQRSIDLRSVLSPPPNALKTNAEIAEILFLQLSRTPAQVAEAVADANGSLWRFAEAIPSRNFNAKHLPKLVAFYKRVLQSASEIIDPAKDAWARPRPFQYSPLVHPCVDKPDSPSYPSGHATIGQLTGILLSEMLPELRPALMARAHEYANNRVLGGVHYRSDVEAGQLAGQVIARELFRHASFVSDFDDAKAELRKAVYGK